jgi:hypothetical protein
VVVGAKETDGDRLQSAKSPVRDRRCLWGVNRAK